jgi:hypothetical protein
MCPHRDPLHRMNRGDHEIASILGLALAAGIASVVVRRFPRFPQAITEVDRILLNFDARFWYVQSSID